MIQQTAGFVTENLLGQRLVPTPEAVTSPRAHTLAVPFLSESLTPRQQWLSAFHGLPIGCSCSEICWLLSGPPDSDGGYNMGGSSCEGHPSSVTHLSERWVGAEASEGSAGLRREMV